MIVERDLQTEARTAGTADGDAASELFGGPGKELGIGFYRSLHPMLIVDAERRYVDANAAAALFMRLRRGEILQHHVEEFVPPEGRGGFDEQWRRFLRQGSSPAESSWYFPDAGTRIPIMVGITTMASGLHLLVVLPWASFDEAEMVLADDNGRGSTLTPREREVLTLLALGRSGEEVAEELFISPETVRTHVQHLRSKLGATTRGHAIALALTRGQISTEAID